MQEKVFVTQTVDETQQVARDLALTLQGGDMVALYGDLGSGKTTFTQGLAETLTDAKRIISPTFIIVRTYDIQFKNQNAKVFYHIDLYRAETQQDIERLGIKEILNDKTAIVVIEWAEKIKDMLPNERIDIYFEYIDENKRKITIENF